ncbi:hypothetical protein QE152_g6122 [Popillia japonica]|uniref:Uncharacterized protein n=1 Tax=Popillia japonica TaxID=7064 RepID=A0AAW1MFR1_POPJA
MAVNGLNFFFISLALLVICQVSYADKNETKAPGVCHLEVPTVDIISESDRSSADLRGNGVRCDMVCSEGHKCVQQCKCDTNTVCDPLTMKCEIDNKEYDLQDGSFHNFSNSGRFENQFQQLPNDHFSTPTALATMFPETTETNYFTSRSAQAVTIITTTENNMKQHDYTAKVSQEASGEYLLNSSIESEVEFPTNKQFDIPVVVNITKKSKWYSDKDKSSTLLNQISAIHRNETSHTVVIDNNLFILVVGVALFTVLIIMSAAVFCVLYKLKEKKKKFITTNNGNNEQRVSNAVPSVSVTTRSIFHTPLPEPPIFENPAFTAQIEGAQAKQSGTLETHVICNMNLPNIKAQNQTKLAEAVELFYDHPPPTGSYRPVLAPELPTSDCKKKSIDPIYDEIPCNQRIVSVATPPPAYTCSEEPMLYMNTK